MEAFLAPVVEHGFLGLCAVQLGVGVWLVRRLLEAVEGMTAAVAAHGDAARRLDERQGELVRLVGEMRDRLLERPCVARHARRRENFA